MSPFCFRPAFDRIGEVEFTGIAVGEIRETGPMMYGIGTGGLFGASSNCQAIHAARNYMDSILLVIPKPEQDNLGTEQTWKSVAPSLQQCAAQANGVITLCENCWLIPAEENGLLFFDHAISVAASANLRCRICLLRTHRNEFARRPPNTRLKHSSAATLRTFQGAVRFVFKPPALRGLAR